MARITVETTGSNKTERYLKRIGKMPIMSYLEEVGRIGVELLASETPKDTGMTAMSWYYTIEKSKYGYTIQFRNDYAPEGVPVVILIQYGHATRNGGYVQPYDFINPITQELMNALADRAWQEVSK